MSGTERPALHTEGTGKRQQLPKELAWGTGANVFTSPWVLGVTPGLARPHSIHPIRALASGDARRGLCSIERTLMGVRGRRRRHQRAAGFVDDMRCSEPVLNGLSSKASVSAALPSSASRVSEAGTSARMDVDRSRLQSRNARLGQTSQA